MVLLIKIDFMKKAILYITVITLLTVSCKKDKDEGPKSYWLVDGVTYKGFALTHPLGSAFDATEGSTRYGTSTGNFISINFSYNYMPTTSRIYAVKKYPLDNTQCSVTVRIVGGTGDIDYTSVDSTSEVSINVSPTGKLSASFSNIVLSYYFTGETKIVSGNLEEQ